MPALPEWFDRLPHPAIERMLITATFLLVLFIVVEPVLPTRFSRDAPAEVQAQRPLRITCSTFTSQAGAQAYYRAHPVEMARLDGNHDGIACSRAHAPYDRVPVDR